MSTIYHAFYLALCNGNKDQVTAYSYKSGLHKHHIVPVHQGGIDEPSNFTYLTPKEHAFAHYLLWEMNHEPNDLRSMHMLGVKLTPKQRSIVGKWCRDNQIGIFGVDKESRREWSYRGYLQQKETFLRTGEKNFYYWSTRAGQKERASLGGTKGAATQMKQKIGIHGLSKEERQRYGRLGVHPVGSRKCMHHPDYPTYKRVPIEEVDQYLKEGWSLGMGQSFKR